MHATFLTHLDFRPHHAYRIQDFDDSWEVLQRVTQVFPEATNCRHCGGCDNERGGVSVAIVYSSLASASFDSCFDTSLRSTGLVSTLTLPVFTTV